MSELFRTEYGAKWFREEGARLDSIERRKLYGQIRDWERVATVGITGWAHAQSDAARAFHNLEHHMRQMLIEVNGMEYIQKRERDAMRKEQERELESLKMKQRIEAERAKLDSKIDDFFN